MMNLLIQREPSSLKSTLGDLFIEDDHECVTLEDVVREIPGVPVEQWKVDGETAIPAGRYRVVWDFSPHFQRKTLHVLEVPGFVGIRIHSGAKAADTKGCPCVGDLKGVDSISGGLARGVLAALERKVCAALFQGEEVWLTIKNAEAA